MAHHNTVRRYPPVDYYDVVAVDRWLERMALNLHDGPYAACLLYDGSGELGRFSARSARWSLGDQNVCLTSLVPSLIMELQGGGRYGPGDSAL